MAQCNIQTASAQLNIGGQAKFSGITMVDAIPGSYFIITEFDIIALGLENTGSYSVLFKLSAGTGVGEFFVPVTTFWAGQFGCALTTFPNLGQFQLANKQGIKYISAVDQALGVSWSISGALPVLSPIVSVNFSYVTVNVATAS